MKTFENEVEENIHILHKSILVLIFEGTMAWLVVSIASVIILYIFQSSQTTTLTFTTLTPAFTAASLFSGLTWTVLAILAFYGATILVIILEWTYAYFTIEPKHITSRSGVIFSKEERHDLAMIESLGVTQGLFGKIFNYGSIHVYIPLLEKNIVLANVADPYKEANFIRKLNPDINTTLFPVRSANRHAQPTATSAKK